MKRWIIGNWKMNGDQELVTHMAERLNKDSSPHQLAVCPPFTLLEQAKRALSNSTVLLGAQNAHFAETGAHTGEVSCAMLKETGCDLVILGHSERRQNQSESSALICRKVKAAWKAGLTAILCLGESLEQREAGLAQKVVVDQLEASLPLPLPEERLIVAYEPIWAIGTGKVASLDDIREMHGFLRERLMEIAPDEGKAVPLLYGGSVKPENARNIFAVADVNGALVGGASLDPESFLAIAG